MPISLTYPHHDEELRADGAGKQKRSQGTTRKAGPYDDWTVYELKMRVKELGMLGYADKTRAQLIDMLRHR